MALGISLLFFNDPFFAVYILFPNEASSVFSVLVTSVFVAYLFSFWVAMIQQFNKARVPYLQLGLFIGLAVLTFSSMLAFHLQSLKDSFFEVDYSTALKVLFVLAVIAYILTTVLIFKLVADVC